MKLVDGWSGVQGLGDRFRPALPRCSSWRTLHVDLFFEGAEWSLFDQEPGVVEARSEEGADM